MYQLRSIGPPIRAKKLSAIRRASWLSRRRCRSSRRSSSGNAVPGPPSRRTWRSCRTGAAAASCIITIAGAGAEAACRAGAEEGAPSWGQAARGGPDGGGRVRLGGRRRLRGPAGEHPERDHRARRAGGGARHHGAVRLRQDHASRYSRRFVVSSSPPMHANATSLLC